MNVLFFIFWLLCSTYIVPTKFTTLRKWDRPMPAFIRDFPDFSEIHPFRQLTVPPDMHSFFRSNMAKKILSNCYMYYPALSVCCFVLAVLSGRVVIFLSFLEKKYFSTRNIIKCKHYITKHLLSYVYAIKMLCHVVICSLSR